MRTPIDERFIREVAAFKLRYSCECCSHFEVQVEHCSLGYPEQPHRLRTLQVGRSLLFCKEFDLV